MMGKSFPKDIPEQHICGCTNIPVNPNLLESQRDLSK
jgi:hypothetical protein